MTIWCNTSFESSKSWRFVLNCHSNGLCLPLRCGKLKPVHASISYASELRQMSNRAIMSSAIELLSLLKRGKVLHLLISIFRFYFLGQTFFWEVGSCFVVQNSIWRRIKSLVGHRLYGTHLIHLIASPTNVDRYATLSRLADSINQLVLCAPLGPSLLRIFLVWEFSQVKKIIDIISISFHRACLRRDENAEYAFSLLMCQKLVIWPTLVGAEEGKWSVRCW